MTEYLGSLIIDVQDKTLSADDRELLNHPLIGGVILFARNYESREQLTHLCREIRASRKTPLLIMVDQEGGRVQRFISEFTRLPFMGEFGKLYDKNSELACQKARDCAWLMATELLTTGIDLSLCPVLDLNKGVSTVIGERAFHSRPDYVIAIASAFMQGMHEAGMAATGKHFPGHGSVVMDSHVANPVDERSLAEVQNEDMLPFRGLVQAGIRAIMAAHIVYPEIDNLPVGYSHYWLNDVLRGQMNFSGVILSDDLSMKGANISENYAERVMAAREAGCDFALLCNNREGVIQVVDNLPEKQHQVAPEKWRLLQAEFTHAAKTMYPENPRWIQTREFLNKLAG